MDLRLLALILAALAAAVHSAAVSRDQQRRERRQDSGLPFVPTPRECFYRATYSDLSFLECHGLGRHVIFGSPEFCSCRGTFERHAASCGVEIDSYCPPSEEQTPNTLAYNGTYSRCLDYSLELQSCLFSVTYTPRRDRTAVFCADCKTLFQETARECLPRLNAHLEIGSVQNLCAASENRTTVTVEVPAALELNCLTPTTTALVRCMSASFDGRSGGDNGDVFCRQCRREVEANARACFGEAATENLRFLDIICQTILP